MVAVIVSVSVRLAVSTGELVSVTVNVIGFVAVAFGLPLMVASGVPEANVKPPGRVPV
jgi:hypothetical protein